MNISIIGTGRVGGALAIALAEKNYQIEDLFIRSDIDLTEITKRISPPPDILRQDDFSQISSDVILIATQDFEIENVAEALSEKLTHTPFVFHTSGSLSSEILQKLKDVGCRVGSIHPLVSISDAVLGSERFEDVYFCVEGDTDAVKIAEKLVSDLGGKSFSIETKYKTLYHASAVTACGHLVALLDVAFEMLSKCGLDEEKSKQILLPLIESTIKNLREQKPSEALTGTFARADFETFEKHFEAIKNNVSNEALKVYLQLGERSLHLAKEQKVSFEKLEKMREKISLAKNNLRC
jgi:predicted short-subunit dehydrogenase-like oxidoreductase (DUF2520 family)